MPISQRRKLRLCELKKIPKTEPIIQPLTPMQCCIYTTHARAKAHAFTIIVQACCHLSRDTFFSKSKDLYCPSVQHNAWSGSLSATAGAKRDFVYLTQRDWPEHLHGP